MQAPTPGLAPRRPSRRLTTDSSPADPPPVVEPPPPPPSRLSLVLAAAAAESAPAPAPAPPPRRPRRPTRRNTGEAQDSPDDDFSSPEELSLSRDRSGSATLPTSSPTGSSEDLRALSEPGPSSGGAGEAEAPVVVKKKVPASVIDNPKLTAALAELAGAEPFSLPNSRAHVALSEDSSVRAASLFKLIECLTLPPLTESPTPGLPAPIDIVAFLLTLRSMFEPAAFLRLLVMRAESSDSEPVRVRVLTVLKSWFTTHYLSDFAVTPALVEILLRFVTERMPAIGLSIHAAPLERVLRATIAAPTADRDAQTRAHEARVRDHAPACAFIPSAVSTISLRVITPDEFARQLTLMEHRLLAAIAPRAECIGQLWTRKSDPAAAPNVKAFIAHFNVISHLVCRSILTHATPLLRASEICNFVDIAQACLELNNFNGVMEILAGLQLSEVFRLTISWDAVPARTMTRFLELKAIMSRDKNMRAPRQALAAATPPCVPYIGMYLTDLTFIEDGNSDTTPEGLINFEKRRMVAGVLSEITRYQRAAYLLRDEPSLQAFIVAPAPEPYDENAAYARSLALESREAIKAHKDTAEAAPVRKKSGARRLSSIHGDEVADGEGAGIEQARALQLSRLRALTMIAAGASVASDSATSAAAASAAASAASPAGPASTVTVASAAAPSGSIEDLDPELLHVFERPSADTLILSEGCDDGSEPTVVAATLHQLVQYQVDPSRPDTAAMTREFFEMHRFFTTARAIYEAAVVMWEASPPAAIDDPRHVMQFKTRYVAPMRNRVIAFLATWRNDFPETMTEDVTILLASFAQQHIMSVNAPAAVQFVRPKSMRSSKSRKALRASVAGALPSLFLPTADWDRYPDGEVRTRAQSVVVRFELLHPEEVARQMTLMLFSVYEAVPTDELVGLSLEGPPRPCANVTTALLRCQLFSNWAATEVVRQTAVEYGLLTLERMLVVGENLLRLRSFDGAMALYRGLCCTAIDERLWPRLCSDGQARWAALKAAADDPSVIASALEAADATEEFAMPYLGAIFMTAKGMKKLPDTHVSGLIHWAKWSALARLVAVFERHKERRPMFQAVPFMQTYYDHTMVLTKDKRDELAAKLRG